MGGIYQKTLDSLEYPKVLNELANFSRCNYSKELCLNLLPEKKPEIIQTLLSFTKEALNILNQAVDIPLEFVIDLSKIDFRPEYFEETELIDFSKTLRSSRLVKNFLRENSDSESLLFNLSKKLYVNKELEDKIVETFDENYNVKHNATQTLSGLYSSLKDTEDNLKSTVTKLLNSPDFNKHLQEQIYTVRDDRIVFQVKAPSKNKIAGIVHDVSATNKTFYIEPNQIVPLNNKIREVKVTPETITNEEENKSYVVGISLDNTVKHGFTNALSYAGNTTIGLYKLMLTTLKQLFVGGVSVKDLSGPVGIYTVVDSQAKQGIQSIIYLTAYLSMNVGVINLLPFPAFDGGRVLFLIIEKIRRKPIKREVEGMVNNIGFGLLMLLMIYVTFNDILRLF